MMKPILSIAMLAATLSPLAAHAQSLMESGQVLEAHSALSPTAAAPIPVPTDPAPVAAPPAGGLVALPAAVPTVVPPALSQDDGRESLFFSHNQIASIMRASQGYIAPKEAYDVKNQGDKPVDAGPRTLTLSGILYHGAHDWTIWFNGQRIMPGRLPERMMNLSVKADHITLKWMDIGNQRVINLTLYPHQQYNIDTNTISPSS